MNAPAIDAKRQHRRGGQIPQLRPLPARLSTATAAPTRIGSAYGSNRGGSFTVSTSITL